MRKAENPLKKSFFSQSLGAVALLLLSQIGLHQAQAEPRVFETSSPKSILTQGQDFDRNDLIASDFRPSNSVSGFSFLNPNRFSMQQSYSVNFASGSMGSSSAGLYLNTLSYKLADPLTLSADVGFHSPLYSSSSRNLGQRGMQDPTQGSSFVLPRLGLEYKPSKNTSFSLHLFNGQDAAKAYGFSNPYLNPWTR